MSPLKIQFTIFLSDFNLIIDCMSNQFIVLQKKSTKRLLITLSSEFDGIFNIYMIFTIKKKNIFIDLCEITLN